MTWLEPACGRGHMVKTLEAARRFVCTARMRSVLYAKSGLSRWREGCSACLERAYYGKFAA